MDARTTGVRRGRIAWFLALLAIVGCGVAALVVPRHAADLEGAPQWIAEPADNLCGLADLRRVSRPAKLRYERAWRSTPEVRRLEREGIDPESPEGILLRAAAVDRVQAAAEAVREQNGYCSVWKAIRHVDGRAVDDVTEPVIEAIKRAVVAAR